MARLGLLSYGKLLKITAVHILLSLLVFCTFGVMFFKMSMKHTKRIKGYLIMAVMMGGGIWLRSSGLVPDVFIAVFYTGLGYALALAGGCSGSCLSDTNLKNNSVTVKKAKRNPSYDSVHTGVSF